MLQLYKSRDFALFFKDTFAFIKMHGKHFFKNYLLVNGLFLLVLIVMSFILYMEVAELQALGLLDERNQREFIRYLGDNSNIYVPYGILYILISAFVGILNYAYIPLYFKLYEKHKGANFTNKEISKELFANFGRLIKFLLVTILISIPLMIAAAIVMGIMAITFIGIPFIVFVVGLISLFYHSALMEYMKYDDKSVFDCYGYSLQLCFQQFFPSIGAVGIFILMIIIFQYVYSFLQGIVLYFLGVPFIENPMFLSDLDKTSLVFIIAFALQTGMYLFNFLTSATLQIHQAVVYYSLKEDRENIHTQDTIDDIGRN
ncbi:hypothetical protein C8N46_103135 [Kordia periserrulae]|uniref:Uncharacterized protein n=1 Tax=Kordia periserrulae TaxID=701523 RepID=A0A2T6C1C6_9FLAO|nr:hypothetical protein [Kordia periserrulae]PTX62037.1 hypothetical protein C8N46_103135 [Kordia periserrulae]